MLVYLTNQCLAACLHKQQLFRISYCYSSVWSVFLDLNCLIRVFSAIHLWRWHVIVLNIYNQLWHIGNSSPLRRPTLRKSTRLSSDIVHLMTYSDKLKSLNLPSLYFRRLRMNKITTYKILHRLVDVPGFFFQFKYHLHNVQNAYICKYIVLHKCN